MPWVKLEDNFFQHPKIAPRSPAAVGIWALGLGYCNYHLTDGFLPTKAATMLGATKKITDELVAAALWKPVPGGWQYHDYHDRQPSAEAIRQRREERAASGRRGAQTRWGKPGSSHGNSHSSSQPDSHGSSQNGADPQKTAEKLPEKLPGKRAPTNGVRPSETPARAPTDPPNSYGNSHSKRDAPSPVLSLVTSSRQSTPGDARPPTDDDEELIDQALDEVGRRRHRAAEQAKQIKGSPSGHLASCQRNARVELREQAERHLAEHPNATFAQLADLIHPPAPPPPAPVERCVSCGAIHTGECGGPPNPEATAPGIAAARAHLRGEQ